ncbi:MAG TPA: hypothetical protein VEH02_00390 [Pseudolabrys sp.]|nr:hypothetical protein [Pseudolabrys sp.]
MPWLVTGGVYVLLIALGPRLLNDPDTYSHIALGRWILEHHAVPGTDPFSATLRGTDWIAFEWLSQVAYALAYAVAGWNGVVVLAAGAVAGALGLLARFLLRDLQPTAVLAAALCALLLTAPHILARPHVLALPVVVIWIALLIRAVDTRNSPPWLLLPLMTLWANLHGSFTFGLAMTPLIACDALWRAPRAKRLNVIRQWGLFGVLAFIAACLNPYGPEMILVTFRTIALGAALTTVTEWRSQDFSHVGSFEIIMLGAIALALYRGVTLPLPRIVMLLGVLHLSLSQIRHADLLGMLAPLFLARPLAEQFSALAANRTRAMVHALWPTTATLLLLAAITGLTTLRNDVVPSLKNTPASALHALDLAETTGPILNDYNFGGYLDFVGVSPFIDGRSELYGQTFMLRYDGALKLHSIPDFLQFLDNYHFRATLLAPSTPAVALLDRLPNWQRVYADDLAVVHIRRTTKPPARKN